MGVDRAVAARATIAARAAAATRSRFTVSASAILTAACALGLVVIASLAGAVPPAFGASNASWEILPANPAPASSGVSGGARVYFVYDLHPGQHIVDAAVVRNLDTRTRTFTLYPANAVNSAGDAAFALLDAGAPRSGVAAWIHLSQTSLTLAAGAKGTVPFELDVPDTAGPGDQTGGVVAAEAAPESGIVRGSARVSVVRALGVRVYARIAGRVHAALALSRVRTARHGSWLAPLSGRGSADITFDVRNTGNVRQSPVATVTVTDELGRTVARLRPEQLPDLLPGGSVSVGEHWDGLPLAGRFTVHVVVRTPQARVGRDVGTWNVAWGDLLAAMAALVGLVVARRKLRRPIGRYSSRVPVAAPDAGASGAGDAGGDASAEADGGIAAGDARDRRSEAGARRR